MKIFHKPLESLHRNMPSYPFPKGGRQHATRLHSHRHRRATTTAGASQAGDFTSVVGASRAIFGSTKALKARACSHSVEHVSKSQRHEVPKQSVCRLRRQQVQESRFAAIIVYFTLRACSSCLLKHVLALVLLTLRDWLHPWPPPVQAADCYPRLIALHHFLGIVLRLIVVYRMLSNAFRSPPKCL